MAKKAVEMEFQRNNFNAGIFSSSLSARSDLSKYGFACEDIENYIIQVYGTAKNRGGTRYVATIPFSRYIPFQFSRSQSFMTVFQSDGVGIVMQDGEIVYDGGNRVEFTHPYALEDLKDIWYTQNADVIYLTHPSYPPQKLVRNSNTDWVLSQLTFSSDIPIVGSVSPAVVGANYLFGVTLYKDGQEGYLRIATDSTNDIRGDLTFSQSPESLGGDYFYIYRLRNGVWGRVDKASGTSWNDINLGGTNPDVSLTPPTEQIVFNAVDTYPSISVISQNRLVFGCSNNQPRTIWGSRTGFFTDFSTRSPLQDDDAYEFTISGDKLDSISWMRYYNGVLLAGLEGGEYLITGGDGENSPITPNSINIKPQTSYGSEKLPSVVAGNTVLFVQAGEPKIRDMFYQLASDVYSGDELSVLADELFENRKVLRVAWERDPDLIYWMVLDNGELVGMTYAKEQEVWAWHRHTTDGNFVDISIITDNDGKDQIYFLIERDGAYFSEIYVHNSIDGEINDSWFLDSALEYTGTPVTTITGLDHLEGREVAAFSMGSITDALLQTTTVVNGEITTKLPVERIVIGLPYISALKTMEFVIGQNNKFSMGVDMNLEKFAVFLKDSCFIEVSKDGINYAEKILSTSHDMGAPFTLFTGKININPPPVDALPSGEIARNFVYVRNKYPLPMTLLAVSPLVTVGT